MNTKTVKRSYSDINDEERKLLLSEKRKYVTLSFDDGVTQDKDLMNIIDKYGIMCTFNINTGLLGGEGTISNGIVTTTHNKVKAEMVKDGYYGEHEVAVHTLTHPSLPAVSLGEVARQITEDERNITELTGIAPTGMAYPGAGYDHNNDVIDVILNCSDLKYARLATSTYGFGLPERFMEWEATLWMFDARLDEITEKFMASQPDENDLIFYIWGHAYELDFFDARDRLDKYFAHLAEDEDIVFVTNRVIYKLFRDKIKP